MVTIVSWIAVKPVSHIPQSAKTGPLRQEQELQHQEGKFL